MGTQYWFGFAVVSVGLLLGTVTLIWWVVAREGWGLQKR